ncbi:MAG: LON peptidase substrate-binding domain-containing protein [Candidatus Sumerlaeia bacterium]|nr:LON peptidase substrate-binding domain-containing protein [Candidatus Sumerlaeia bacterium]
MEILQPILPVLTLPSAVLFPRALLDLRIVGNDLGCEAGEWLTEGALWGIATLRVPAGGPLISRGVGDVCRTLGIGSIIHREKENGCIRRLVIEGLARGRIIADCSTPRIAAVQIEVLRDYVNIEGGQRKNLARAFDEMVRLARQVADAEPVLRAVVRKILTAHPHPGVVADLLAHHCIGDLYTRQCLLAETDVCRRVGLVSIQLAQMIRRQSLHPLRRFR